ncbi:MAG: AAA family ATPase [Clostridia bacterium]
MPTSPTPEEIQQIQRAAEVPVARARRVFHPDDFPPDGAGSQHLGLIGQERAVAALQFALTMHAHAVLVGPVGTGKTTHALRAARDRAGHEPTPPDRIFVPDLERPRLRHLVEVPPARGREFQAAVDRLVNEGGAQVRSALESDSYQHRRQLLIHQYQDEQQRAWSQALSEAEARGFAVEMTPAGPVITIPLNPQGQPYSPQEFMALPVQVRAEFQERQRALEEPLGQIIRHVRALQREAADALAQDARQMAEETLGPLLESVSGAFRASPDALSYFSTVARDMAAHLEDLVADPPPGGPPGAPYDNRYQVEVLVEHEADSGTPVLLEANPTFRNLFGRIEVQPGTDRPPLATLHAGSVARANGGYLVVPLAELLQDALAYAALKRALKLGQYRIEAPEVPFFGPTAPVTPDPIPVSLMVMLVGTPDLYTLLFTYDDDFRRLFPIKVEFEPDMEASPAALQAFRQFVEDAARREAGRPLGEGGLETLAGFSAELAEDQGRLSARLGEVTALLREAAVFARTDESPEVLGRHLKQARMARRERVRGAEETVARLLNDGTLLIDTEGAVVGQVNGLAVMSSGDQAFGRPSRITAVVHVGRSGVVNIERESQQSGATHTKGVLTLAAYLASRFAQRYPLSLGASLAFEQLYGGIDGDSASSAELYALLSALSDLPVHQGIAVTGSINQKGEIQPIGGVNEKVAGFFRLCAAKHLTGEQGVIIPRRNVRNLMLDDDVLEALRAGQFHLWAIDHVEQGIALLTGVAAGTPDDDADTVMGRVAARLRSYYEATREADERGAR